MGVTKRIYERQIINAKRDIKKYLRKIELILPKEYDERKIIELLELYYEFHCFTGFKQHKIVDLPACIVSSGSFRHFLAS